MKKGKPEGRSLAEATHIEPSSALALMVGGCAINRSGLWEAEDCKKISDASGLLLYVSGELLEEADKLKKKGNKQRQVNLMRVYYFCQNWLQTTQKLLKLIANRQMDSYWRGKMVRGTSRMSSITRAVS